MPWTSELANTDDRLPSIKQYLKNVSKDALDVTFLIKLIWFPSSIPNYTLDTEAFRLRIPSDNYLYTVLEENLEDWVENERVIGIQIESKIPLRLTLIELESDTAPWSELGELGIKLGKVSARGKKKPDGKNPRNPKTKLYAPPEA